MTILTAAAVVLILSALVAFWIAGRRRRIQMVTLVFDDNTLSEGLRGVRMKAALDVKDGSILMPKLPVTPSPYDVFYAENKRKWNK